MNFPFESNSSYKKHHNFLNRDYTIMGTKKINDETKFTALSKFTNISVN